MHIPDNYLSPETCAVLGVAALSVVGYSIKKVKLELTEKAELAPMLGIAASLSFLMMMFNVPIPGGTTAHAVGGTLLAILIGPYAACLAVTVALILQSFLFADGGIIALGANLFNMACVMPFVGYGIYRLFQKGNHSHLGVILGSYLGINAAALLVGLELGLQPLLFHTSSGEALYNPYPLSVTIPAMLFSHLLIAGPVEVLFTYVIYRFVKKVAPNDLYVSEQSISSPSSFSFRPFYYLLGALVLLSPIGLIAQGTAFGEWSKEEMLEKLKVEKLATSLPQGMQKGLDYQGIFSDYTIPGTSLSVGYILSAITAILLFVLIGKLIGSLYAKKRN